MAEENTNTRSVISAGPMFLLFLLFLGLRLSDQIHWAWYWVAAPLWIPLGFAALLVLGAMIVLWLTTDKG